MKFWSRYWSRLWEPAQKEKQPEETPELAPGREQLPPAMAQQLMRQTKVPGGGGLRQRAARMLQGVTGNRRLAGPNPGRPLPPAFFERHGTVQSVDRPGGIVGEDTVLNAPLERT